MIWRDHVGMRRLLALVHGLGPTSRTWKPETGGWGTAEHLLAVIADRVEDTRMATYAASQLTFKQPEPRHVPRPNEDPPKKRGLSMRDFFAMQGVTDG